jgi:ubiquinone/menaquinone biosynthesis C-methylase UbiE
MNLQSHWQSVYNTKSLQEVSWFQPVPQVSLDFLSESGISKDAAIIDVGGGDSFFADYLLNLGYTNITVLDISEAAISRAKKRIGKKANQIKWVVSDITEFVSEGQFDFWHDRATFHFLTSTEQIEKYLAIANNAITSSGKIVIGTFSESGPSKCSGLPIKQYNESLLTVLIKKWFQKIKCIHADHVTPFNTIQNFLFCSFKKVTG